MFIFAFLLTMASAVARTLVVESSAPTVVSVTASPPDSVGTSQGVTGFTLNYPDATEVTVTAPNAVGRYRFQKWLKDGATFESGLSARVTMDANHTLKAVYVEVVPTFPANLQIMPLGDSITFGFNGGNAGYRGPLHTLLSPLATNFRYIGTSSERPGTLPSLPINQRFHEGHPSYTIQDVSNNLDGFDNARFLQFGGVERNPNGGYWLTGGNGTGRAPIFPDIITLMAGTNDMATMPGVEGRLQALITKITTQRPATKLLVAMITPIPAISSDEAYNLIVPNVVANFQAAGKKVYLVDLNTGFPGNGLDPDGIHPNDIGFNWMASRWFEAIVAAYSPATVQRPYLGTPRTIPGLFQAEDFDDGGAGVAYQDLTPVNEGGQYRGGEGVDIQPCGDTDGGFQIFHTEAGEWLEYTVTVDSAGGYLPRLRISNPTPGGEVYLEVDGVDVTNNVAIPDSGGTGNWQTVALPEIHLSQGAHVLRLVISNTFPDVTAGAINWLSFTATSSVKPSARAGSDIEVIDQNGNGSELVTLNASATVAGDSPELTYTWSRGGVALAGGVNPTVTLPTGAQVIQLTVTDGNGLIDTDEVLVTVSPKGFVNGSFESGFTGWNTSGNLSIGSTAPFLPTDGAKLVDFNGADLAPNAILSQSFATAIGGTYSLTFDLGVLSFAANSQTMQATVTGTSGLLSSQTIVITGPGGGNTRWLPQSFTFEANSPTSTITFRDMSSTSLNLDMLLDNVHLTGPPPVPINTAPVAVADAYSTNESTALTIPPGGLLANDSDAQSNPLSAVPNVLPGHGTLSLNLNGGFTYTPAAGYFGTDSFTYRATDGFLNSNIVTVSLTVNEVIPPPVAVADSYSTSEDVPLVVPANGVLSNDADPRSRPLTAVLDAGPGHGSIGFNADGSFVYTPVSGYYGTDTFTYHSRNGFMDSNVVTVSLVVQEVIPPPVAVADSYVANENIALVVQASGVLGNDADPRSRPLTALLDTGPAHGTLDLHPNGSFTYTSALNYYGTDSFTYHANNGVLNSGVVTVNLVINEVIPPPVAVADSYSTDDHTLLVVPANGVLGNDSDPRSRPLTALLDTGPVNGTLDFRPDGSFSYMPAGNYFGPDSFTYHTRNGFLDSNVATVNLTVINRNIPAPVAAADSYSTGENIPLAVPAAGVLANDSDPASRPITALLNSGPAHGTLALNSNGSFNYTPATGYIGSDSFTYHARNGFLDSEVVTVRLRVYEIISAPLAAADSYATNESTALVVPAAGVLSNDTDPKSRPLTAGLASAPGHGSLSLNTNGSFTYNPAVNFFGTDSFTYYAKNGFLESNLVTVSLTVNEVIPPPVAVADSYSANESTPLVVVAASGVLANDSDPRSRPLAAIRNTGPGHGTLTLNANGSFTYTPTNGYFGADSFTYHTRNGFLDSNIVTVNLNVNEVIPPPVATGDSYVTNESTPLVVPAAGVLANDSDPRSRALTAGLASGPSHGTLSLNTNGSFTYSPASNFFGSDSFTYYAKNGFLESNVVTVILTVNEVIPPPVAAADSYVTNESTTLVIPANGGVLANDSDPRSRPLTAVLEAGPSHGTLVLNVNGGFTYIPVSNFYGTDSFSYRARNGFLNSPPVIVSLAVNEIVPPPLAAADSYSTNENTPLVVPAAGVLANDSDPRSRPLTAVLDTGPGHGTLSLNANGSFNYTPANGYFGPDSFTYHSRNGFLNSSIVTVSLTVNEVIPPPVALGDSYVTNENVTLVIPAAGVLANDSDPRSRPLTAVLDTGPGHGTLSLNANGSFSYSPANSYYGPDSFTYHSRNGFLNSNIVTVNLTVNEVIPPPVATGDSYVTNENITLVVPAAGVLANDSDPRSRPLTAVINSGPAHGTLALSSNGSFSYTPANGYFGADSFTYHCRNGFLDSNVVTVTIIVNEVIPPPVAAADSYVTNENTALVVPAAGLLANDSDPRSRPLTAVLDAPPAHGSVSLNPNGSFTYTPVTGYFGSDSFTYHARNGFLNSNTVTVSVVINEVITPPTAVADSYSTSENTTLVVAAAGVLANDSDAVSRPLTAILVGGPGHGTLSLNANGSFTYTPAAGYFGADTFTYRASNGTLNSGIATVAITINEVIPAPVAAADFYSTNSGTVLVVPASGVLANDTDTRSRPLTAVLVSGPANGTLTLNATGSFTYSPAAGYTGNDAFSYRANNGTLNSNVVTVSINVPFVFAGLINGSFESGFTGWTSTGNQHIQSTLPYVPTDGTKLVGYNGGDQTPNGVLSQSFATVAGNTYTLAFDLGVLSFNTNSQTMQVTANGTNNLLTRTITITGLGGGTNRWLPQSFTFVANSASTILTFRDQSSSSLNLDMMLDNVRVTGPPVVPNNAPVALADSYSTNQNNSLVVPTAGVLANDTDAQSQTLSAYLNTGPQHGTVVLNTNGSFTYTPTIGYFGSDSFTYRANDGSLNSNITTVNLTVNGINTAPVAVADSYSINQNTALVVSANGVLSNDTDAQSQALTAILDSGPGHGTLTLNPNGGFTYTPANGYFGGDFFTYHANDGTLNSGVVSVNLTINEVIVAPVAAADSYSTNESTVLVVLVSGVLSNDSDAGSRPLTAILDAGPSHGSVVLNNNGSFTYTPAAGYFGTDSFTYHANNGILNSNVVNVGITINEVIPAPLAVADSYSTNENTALVVPAAGVLANDTDPRSRPLASVLNTGPSHGTLALNANGAFTYTPAAGYFGADSFTYRANNGSLNSNPVSVNLTINEVIPPPVAVADSYTTNEGSALFVPAAGLLANDSDPRSRPLTAVLNAGPSHGTLTLTTNGSFTYTPAAGYFGPDSFTYRANNGSLNSNVVTVGITVNEVIPPPVAVGNSYTTSESTALVVPAAGVLANDTDPRSRPLTALLNAGPSHGTLALNANGGFTYTPTAGYFGTDSFTYRANNGSLDSNVVTVGITINEVIPPPVAVADSYTTNESTALVVAAAGVLANDSDPRSRPLTAVLITGPSHGTLALNTNGGFIFTPVSGYFGIDSFTYRANNGSLVSNVVSVGITINEVIPPPVAVADSYSTNESIALVVPAAGLLANDSDPRFRPLTTVLNTGPGHGTLALNANGSFTYTPATGYFGPDSFTYRANNGSLNSNLVTVGITINEVIPPPMAVADSYSTNEGTALVIPAAGVLANDSDPRSRPLTAVLSSGPSHGTLALNANGGFNFTPAAGYFGTDSFTYRANNGSLNSNLVTVGITINEVIPPPVAVSESYATNESTALVVAAAGVLANDSDPRSRPLTAVLNAGPSHGSLTLNANGSFTYTPAAGFFGTDSFTYRANNGSLNSNLVTVAITVNQVLIGQLVNGSFESGFSGWTATGNLFIESTAPYLANHGVKLAGFNGANTTPNAVLSQSFATLAGQSYTLDFDAGVVSYNTNSQTLQVSATGTGSLLSQTVTIFGLGGGFVQWFPRSFTFIANSTTTTLTFRDLSSSTSGLDMVLDNVRISNTPNTAPVAVADSYTTNENTALVVPASGLLANDTDAQSQPLTAVLNAGPAHGTLALNANGGFTYTPAAGYFGSDSFTYHANDGSLDSNVATVSLTIIQANTAPVATSDSYSTNQNTALVVPAAGVLANDTDAQSQPLTALLTSGPAHGTVALNPNGGFTYTPATGYTGSDSFTYRASDGSLDSNIATVNLTVNVVVGLVNGSFESGFTGWTATGNIVIQTAAIYSPTHGTQLAGFNGANTAPNAVLSQTFATVPGQTCTLAFDAGVFAYNTNAQTMLVTVAGTSNLLTRTITLFGNGAGSSLWLPQSFTFVPDSASTTLTFRDQSATTAAIDLLLDNVRVTAVTPIVPPEGSPDLGSISLSGAPGDFTIRMSSGQPGTYFLERSEDLTTWERVTEMELTAPGPVEFHDTQDSFMPEGPKPRMFYRIGLK